MKRPAESFSPAAFIFPAEMKQRTILLAGELGAGLGHAMPLFRIAETLHGKAKNHGIDLRCVFALHDPSLLHDLKAPGDLVLQAPSVKQGDTLRSHSGSYAEILIASGFASPDLLARGISSWDDLFALCDPALVVADHSPTAVLAARGRRPVLVTGNGFTVPPAAMETFPALLAGRAAPAIQGRLLDNVNALLLKRGLAAIKRLPEFLVGDARAVFTIADLDPYGSLRDSPLAGPYEKGLTPSPLPSERRIFLYGHANVPSFPILVRAAIETGFPVSAYLAGINPELTFLLRQHGAQVFEKAPPLREVLPRVRLVVSNGGAGLALATLIAGRPHILCPIHTESQMTARALERLGVAVSIENPAIGKAVDAITTAMADDQLHDRCLARANTLQETLTSDPLAVIADQILQRIS